MSTTRLLWPGSALCPGECLVPEDVARHARVTRLGPGEPVELLDLRGAVAIGRFLGWRGTGCAVEVETVVHERGEPPAPLVLGLAILHTDAFAWAVEKATELGVTAVVPVLTTRVQGRRHEARVERWQRVADAAVAQCGRSRAPRLEAPEPLLAFLRRPASLRLVAEPGSRGFRDVVVDQAGAAVLVGPEGGLLEAEVCAAQDAGFGCLPLGPRTLRAETAAVVALTLTQRIAGWL